MGVLHQSGDRLRKCGNMNSNVAEFVYPVRCCVQYAE